jgi:PEP-CTERM motif
MKSISKTARYIFGFNLFPLLSRLLSIGVAIGVFICIVFSQASNAAPLWLATVSTPITFTESAGTHGFYAVCPFCVSFVLGGPVLNGLDFEAFNMATLSPASPTPQTINGDTIWSQTLEGGTIFDMTNPDGTLFLNAETNNPIGTNISVTILGIPNQSNAEIELQIPGPVTVNGNGLNSVISNLYIAIFGDLFPNTTLNTGLVGSPYENCQSNNPAPFPYCQNSFLSFSMDATIEASTSPITFASAFAPPIVSAPEPTTLSLVGLGLAGIGFAKRRKSS